MKKNGSISRYVTILVQFLASKKFTWFVVMLLIFQAAWLALSFRYPIVFDEYYHFGIIKVFTQHLWPIIYDQPEHYDAFRDLSIGSTLFHYVLSFPYRLISLVIENFTLQVISLRLLNIGLAASGLLLFVRLFREVNVPRAIINVALLFFVLIPIVSHVTATINYDNALFLLTPLFLLLSVKAIMAKTVDWRLYAGILLVGMCASLVKFSFLPIFAAALVYLSIFIWKQYGLKSFFNEAKKSLMSTSKALTSLMIVSFTVIATMFVSAYLVTTILYGTPHPPCAETLSKERCLKDNTVERNFGLLETREQRQVGTPSDYFWEWAHLMTLSPASTASVTPGGLEGNRGMPIVLVMLTAATVLGIAVLLYAWRGMFKNRAYYFLLTIASFYVAVIFVKNLMTYYRLHEILAVQPRYILIVLPIFMVMITLAVNFVLGRFRVARAGLFLVVLAAFMLGGAGLTTHIMSSSPSWYWQQRYVIEANQMAQKLLRPLVKETL